MTDGQIEDAKKRALFRAMREGRVWARMRGNDVSHLALNAVWAAERFMKRWC